jgi:hypothetical protein
MDVDSTVASSRVASGSISSVFRGSLADTLQSGRSSGNIFDDENGFGADDEGSEEEEDESSEEEDESFEEDDMWSEDEFGINGEAGGVEEVVGGTEEAAGGVLEVGGGAGGEAAAGGIAAGEAGAAGEGAATGLMEGLMGAAVLNSIETVGITVLVAMIVCLFMVLFGGGGGSTAAVTHTVMVVASLTTGQMQAAILSSTEAPVLLYQPQWSSMLGYKLLPTANFPLVPSAGVSLADPPARPDSCETPILGRRKLSQAPAAEAPFDGNCELLQRAAEETTGAWAKRTCFKTAPGMATNWGSLWNAGVCVTRGWWGPAGTPIIEPCM